MFSLNANYNKMEKITKVFHFSEFLSFTYTYFCFKMRVTFRICNMTKLHAKLGCLHFNLSFKF